ncbi:hypothetical protein [Escherichia phage vB_EcoS_PHB17]|uniref:Uncharacterized protein n=1 Tax=Escherichia phage vB_EcoS_PHB17 TaxID=2591407 RepID=A0A514DKR1_9CAUD|nr:hypothetical protein KMB84_gp10 [Escherichia phage vB_EcoS_PHB17]QDH94213.1 hypothetical protein [Escherichia phage vB_EcoS_PHB17]
MISAWFLVSITYYCGLQPIEFTSHKACIEARETIKKNTPGSWANIYVCVKK